MAAREQIQQTMTLLAEVTDGMPMMRVPLADFPTWVSVMDADTMTVVLRYDGRVVATVGKWFGDKGHLFVEAVADVVRDLVLPPCPEGAGFGASLRLPVDDVWRLELLAASKTEVA